MKLTSKYSKVAWFAAFAAMAVGYNATANTIQMDVSTIIDGSFVSGDGSSKPYLTGVFEDVSGGVQMTLSAQGLGYAGSGNYEHVLAWLFNVDSSQIGNLTFTKT